MMRGLLNLFEANFCWLLETYSKMCQICVLIFLEIQKGSFKRKLLVLLLLYCYWQILLFYII